MTWPHPFRTAHTALACNLTAEAETAGDHRRHHRHQDYWFCSPGCAETFDAAPDTYSAGGLSQQSAPETKPGAPRAR